MTSKNKASMTGKTMSCQKQKIKPPKRNKSAFIIFSQDVRPKLKMEININSNEMMVKLAKHWKDLSIDEREAYEKQAAEDKARYLKEIEAFKQNCPIKIAHNRTKKTHVKRACSAYAIFLKENHEQVRHDNPGLKMAEILKIISQKWKELALEKKRPYQRKAIKEEQSIKNQLLEKKMIQSTEKPQAKRQCRTKKVIADSQITSTNIPQEESKEDLLMKETEDHLEKSLNIICDPLEEVGFTENNIISPTSSSVDFVKLKLDSYSPLPQANIDILAEEQDEEFQFAEALLAQPSQDRLFDLTYFDFEHQIPMNFKSLCRKNSEEFLKPLNSLFKTRAFS